MGEMPDNRVEGYNELIIEYGWIVLFAPACPAAALIAIFSNMIQYRTEKNAIGKFSRRCEPKSTLDIGKWLDYFELMSTIGIVNSVGLVIFTSKRLEDFNDDGRIPWAELVITVFIIENCLIAFRAILAAAIPDYPDWIEKEIFANENRVKQVKAEIADKDVHHKVAVEPDEEGNQGNELELVEECMSFLHPDRDLSALLVKKLLVGSRVL